jgi:hypothetical protein
MLGRWLVHGRKEPTMPAATRLQAKARTDRRRGQLTLERITDVETLAGWTWDPVEDDRQHHLDQVRVFASVEGHCERPRSYVANGFPLGRLVSHRRREYWRGTLGSQRISLLEAIPGWTWGRSSKT